jgi:hypothetical protein
VEPTNGDAAALLWNSRVQPTNSEVTAARIWDNGAGGVVDDDRSSDEELEGVPADASVYVAA